MAKRWISKATDNAHGQFAAKAKAAGKSTKEYAEEKKDAPGKLGKQARLALTLMGVSHNKGSEKKRTSPKEARNKMYGTRD